MAEMSSLLREARDLNATLESEVVKLQTISEEERKKTEEAKIEVVAATERCSRTMKRLDDLRAATEVREDSLNKVISDLEAKVKVQTENELNLNSIISLLCKVTKASSSRIRASNLASSLRICTGTCLLVSLCVI